MIPLVDLQAAHAEVAEEIELGFKRILANTAFIGGDEVAAFEREFAAFSGVAHCVGVANGTDALELLIDVDAALAAVTPATRAVVPVHLYGQLAPVERLAEALAGTAVTIVEDAAQCQGATRHGRGAGSWGIAATSFYPGKNLGAYGDAGAVLSTGPEVATTVRMLANHGGLAKYEHQVIGCNSRLDGLQAVVLRAKLARLAAGNAARRAAAARYDTLLGSLDVVRPAVLPGNEPVWHLYVIQVPARRDEVLATLNRAGIGAGIHYPVPVHLTPAFAGLGYRPGDFPHAEAAAQGILSLPLFPQIRAEQQERVVEVLAQAIA
ncbi:MAG: erythromycin biosynthesis sensory transduction protein eryC1 [Actinobacteria bacterium 13_2_20CM_2_71_6]|nr:MAG: erythromycin biosynthesis sensory transduction protein eryC1 [Actinobacteria bacterium 13_2_20CM_2_71_6]